MLFGDPVYDERGQVVKRNFGLMNAIMIVLLVVIGIGLFKGFPNMKPKSGKKKMKGGGWITNGIGNFVAFLISLSEPGRRWSVIPIAIILAFLAVWAITPRPPGD